MLLITENSLSSFLRKWAIANLCVRFSYFPYSFYTSFAFFFSSPFSLSISLFILLPFPQCGSLLSSLTFVIFLFLSFFCSPTFCFSRSLPLFFHFSRYAIAWTIINASATNFMQTFETYVLWARQSCNIQQKWLILITAYQSVLCQNGAFTFAIAMEIQRNQSRRRGAFNDGKKSKSFPLHGKIKSNISFTAGYLTILANSSWTCFNFPFYCFEAS